MFWRGWNSQKKFSRTWHHSYAQWAFSRWHLAWIGKILLWITHPTWWLGALSKKDCHKIKNFYVKTLDRYLEFLETKENSNNFSLSWFFSEIPRNARPMGRCWYVCSVTSLCCCRLITIVIYIFSKWVNIHYYFSFYFVAYY